MQFLDPLFHFLDNHTLFVICAEIVRFYQFQKFLAFQGYLSFLLLCGSIFFEEVLFDAMKSRIIDSGFAEEAGMLRLGPFGLGKLVETVDCVHR
jgi:hypothetical protein